MKLDWVKSIPDYIKYFNTDNKLIIELIGIDNYLKMFEIFGKTGIYFSVNSNNFDQENLINQIGIENYTLLRDSFKKSGIYFSSTSLRSLKRKWAIRHHRTPYNEAARVLEVSIKTIYNWRNSKRRKED